MNGPPGGEPVISGSRPSRRPLLLGFTVCAATPPVATDWIQRRGRGAEVCVCDDNGDCKGGLRIGECVCVCIR